VLRDVHQSPAVVAEIEHELVHARGRKFGKAMSSASYDGCTKLRKKM